MNKNVFSLPATTTMTPEQALASAGQLELGEVLVIGHDKDGELVVRSSRMDSKNALWLLKLAELYTMGQIC